MDKLMEYSDNPPVDIMAAMASSGHETPAANSAPSPLRSGTLMYTHVHAYAHTHTHTHMHTHTHTHTYAYASTNSSTPSLLCSGARIRTHICKARVGGMAQLWPSVAKPALAALPSYLLSVTCST